MLSVYYVGFSGVRYRLQRLFWHRHAIVSRAFACLLLPRLRRGMIVLGGYHSVRISSIRVDFRPLLGVASGEGAPVVQTEPVLSRQGLLAILAPAVAVAESRRGPALAESGLEVAAILVLEHLEQGHPESLPRNLYGSVPRAHQPHVVARDGGGRASLGRDFRGAHRELGPILSVRLRPGPFAAGSARHIGREGGLDDRKLVRIVGVARRQVVGMAMER